MRGRDEKLDLDPEEKFNRKYIITCINIHVAQ